MARSHNNAIVLLEADHREVEQLFKKFEEAEGKSAQQAALASQIGQALSIHAELEEVLLYPRVFSLTKGEERDQVCEATVEHGTLRGLIADMNGKDPSDPMVKARVIVLKEYVQHHVREEENELFPQLETLELDLDALGEEIATMKRELLEQVGSQRPGKTIQVVEVSASDTRQRRVA
jgi:hemerythrin superfamily protein